MTQPMHAHPAVRAAPLALLLAAGGEASVPARAGEAATMIEQAREWTSQLQTQIRGDVVKELETGGPLRSLIVCKYSAPEVTSVLSRRHGARITRVSLRPRNPATGMADAWEQKTLQEFEARVARGDPGDRLEYGELVSEPAGRFYRYARAITVLAPCLVCHGSEAQLSPAVRAMLGDEYPKDAARGYAVGQVIGAVSVKMPR